MKKILLFVLTVLIDLILFIKKLFCKHNFNDGCVINICKKCGKEIKYYTKQTRALRLSDRQLLPTINLIIN